MIRKFLLAGTALCVLSTASCSMFTGPAGPAGPPGTTPPAPAPVVVSAASISNDVSLIANGIANALNNPSVKSLIPPAALPKIQQAVADLQSLSSQIAADPNAQVTKANVTQVESLVNDIVADVGSLPLPAPWPTILTAAQVLLPVVESAVGIIVPAGEMAAKKATPMNAAAARKHLSDGH